MNDVAASPEDLAVLGILGPEEACCGDSLRRLGNEYVFAELAMWFGVTPDEWIPSS